jgi:serine/threonine-protein kinase
MNADRWRQVSRLFHEVLAVPADERPALLERLCDGDSAIRDEVESLLRHDGSTATFLGPSPVAAPDRIAVGDTLGVYRIERELGRGGMGTVFLAYDTKLMRRAAVKVVTRGPAEWTLQEARNAAALSHPNICTILEVSETEGTAFIAMEYVEGRSLRARLDEGPLPLVEALDFGAQIADALDHAHAHQVVHCDLKAANVIVNPAGRLKIVDFGLATRGDISVGSSHPAAGRVAGTPYAMAPEQIRGEAAAAKRDVWALGILLQEMVTAKPPFDDRSREELFRAILSEAPTSLPPTLPEDFRTVVTGCLEKAPERRLDAGSVRDRLRALHLREQPRSAGRRLAVLPLRNLTGEADQQYFADGIHEALITDFTQLGALSVIARPSVMRYNPLDTPVPQIAADLKVDLALTGAVMRSGDRVRVTVQLLDAVGDQQLWAGRFERDVAGLLTLHREVVLAVAQEIGIELTPLERARLTRTRAVNPSAFDAYLQGRFHLHTFSPEGFEKGMSLLYQAIAIDPSEPLAHAAVAYGHSLLELFRPSTAEDVSRARTAARRALELDDSLAEAHEAMAFFKGAKEWDPQGAERSIRRALELNPNLASAHAAYAQYLAIFGDEIQAVAEWTRSVALDPMSALYRAWFAGALWEFGRFERALEEARRALDLHPDFPVALIVEGLAHLDAGRGDDAVAVHEKACRLYHRQGFSWILARTCALTGRIAEARAILAGLEAGAPGDLPHPWFIAGAYAVLDEPERALDWLERAFEARILFMMNLARPRAACVTFDALRGHPRFENLLRKLHLR